MATEKVETTDTEVKTLSNGDTEVVTETVVKEKTDFGTETETVTVETTLIEAPTIAPDSESVAEIIEENTEVIPWQEMKSNLAATIQTLEELKSKTLEELATLRQQQADHSTLMQSLSASVDALAKTPEPLAALPVEPLPVESEKPTETKAPKTKPQDAPRKKHWI